MLQALDSRGHAAVNRIKLDTPPDTVWREGKLPLALSKARAYPQWSSLNPGARVSQAERLEQIEALVMEI